MAAIYDTRTLARKLGVKERTLRRYLKERKLTGFKVGREWRFTEQDLQGFIKRQRPVSQHEQVPA